ncbi:hypothetical protein B0H11DRAFT_2305351 [Mycena galericulata]|nr:hypothetical protein B0H11DRAFT_2305351 [Mycena galericulata]
MTHLPFSFSPQPRLPDRPSGGDVGAVMIFRHNLKCAGFSTCGSNVSRRARARVDAPVSAPDSSTDDRDVAVSTVMILRGAGCMLSTLEAGMGIERPSPMFVRLATVPKYPDPCPRSLHGCGCMPAGFLGFADPYGDDSAGAVSAGRGVTLRTTRSPSFETEAVLWPLRFSDDSQPPDLLRYRLRLQPAAQRSSNHVGWAEDVRARILAGRERIGVSESASEVHASYLLASFPDSYRVAYHFLGVPCSVITSTTFALVEDARRGPDGRTIFLVNKARAWPSIRVGGRIRLSHATDTPSVALGLAGACRGYTQENRRGTSLPSVLRRVCILSAHGAGRIGMAEEQATQPVRRPYLYSGLAWRGVAWACEE